MQQLARFVRFAEAINAFVGRWASWLTLVTVLVCATVVIFRYAFAAGIGWVQQLYKGIGGTIWLQELYIWTHAAAFMLGAGYTYMADKHVRVDVIYANRSPRAKAWLDLVSTIVFLFPWIFVLGYFAWPYVLSSWQLWETSQQVGGMPGLYVLKSVILVFCGLMLLQGLAMCARSILTIGGREDLLPPIRVEE